MATPQEQIQQKLGPTTKNGKPRATRPDGSYYSTDPKERYEQLVEDGKMGGELAREHGKLGGRPKNISAQELVAEKARAEADLIWSGLRAGLTSDSVTQRRESALAILGVEEKYFKRQEREQQAKEGMNKDELIKMLVDKIVTNPSLVAQVKSRMASEEVVDATVVGEERQLPARGADRATTV